MIQKKFITSIILLSTILVSFGFFALPAQAIDTVPPIPVSDSALRDKEAGITVFGYTVPGFGWDSILITIAKKTISRIVDSTVTWINSGFDGNPAYVTDPGQYFTDVADGVAGEFIKGSELGFLCSPFQANIKVSLLKQYSPEQPFQCTLDQVVGNIENFYDDFSQGGWDAWFSMTQDSSNNPYGAYLQAKIELDSRITDALHIKQDQLNWGRGLLSYEKCEGITIPANNSDSGKEECLDYTTAKPIKKKIVTPGATIENQLSNVLGTGIRQLELADEFDEIVGALIGQLLDKTVFSKDGLAKAPKVSGPGGPTTPPTRYKQVDIDGDGIMDGTDSDGDGSPDICFYGGADNDTVGPPCKASGDVVKEAPTFPGGGGGQCSEEGMQYQGALVAAESAVLAANPDVADLPNIEEGGRQNARKFLNLVATELQGKGYNASTDVLNGNNNPNTGDLIAIWKSTDQTMERYDAISGGAAKIKDAAQATFTGFIPLTCTPSGGSKDCGCKDTTEPPVEPPGGGSDALAITSVSPTSATAGVTTLTITGTNLTTTVQFFDGGGARTTVTGTVNAAKTQTTILVPGTLPTGSITVKIYKDANTVSNGKTIQITNTGGGGGTFPAPVGTKYLDLGNVGVFPDVTWYQGRLWLAYRGTNTIEVYSFDTNLQGKKTEKIFNLNPGAGGFPRMTTSNNTLWVAFRDGEASGEDIKLWRKDTDTTESLGPAWGNNPVALGFGYIAWQNWDGATSKIYRRVLTGGTNTLVGNSLPTGISRVLSSGNVVTADTDRTAASWGLDAWFAGDMTVAVDITPHDDNGIAGRFSSSAASEFNLWANQRSHNPHAATDGNGNYAVAVWNPNIRVAVFTKAGGGGGGGISTTEPTSSWSPTLTSNGWWAKLSPDGRYVTYGNWGESWVTDLDSPTKQSWNFSSPSDLPPGTRCIAGKWMSATKMTFTCELTSSTMARYEVTAGEWVAKRTADNTSNVAANEFAAGGGHWASYAVGGGIRRIVKDNQLLTGINAGGGLSLSGNELAHICSDGFAICVWNNFAQTKNYPVATGVTGGPDLYNGYVAYASLGYIYGITPTGVKTDISVTGWKNETNPLIVPVSGARWVATFAGNESIGYYFLIRPWGEKKAITVRADGLLGSVIYKSGNFIISEYATNGALKVITIPADAPRISI